MKHYNFKILLVVLMSLFGTKAIAYDIVVKNSDSIAIFYNYINNDKELEVTCYSEEIVDPDIYYGDIAIPDEVLYKGKTLKVTSIGNKAFYGCEKLMSVSFPKYLNSIGKDAFCNCKCIQKLHIPENVTSIELASFSGCYGLLSITVDNGNMNYDSRYNCNAIIETKTNTLIVGCNKTTIPNDVIIIGSAAFYGCSEIKDLELPKAVKEIYPHAFANCKGLSSIDLPNTLTFLGYGAFAGCTGLSSITIPPSITYISSNLFANCSGLISLTLPNVLTDIGDNAFYECTSLKSMSLPNSVTYIGSCAFQGCQELIDFIIPNNIKVIKYNTFAHCINLESVTIPKSIQKIEDGPFIDCPALKDVYCLAEDVPETISHPFSNTSSVYNSITLHVPASSVDKYKSTYPWSLVGSIVALTNEAPSPNQNTDNTIAGFYLTQPDSYRVYNGNNVNYGRAFEVLITDNGDGTYYVDDLAGGWYCQRAGYGTNYAISGNIAITEDGTVSLINSYVPGWNDGLVGLTGRYDSSTSTFTIEAEYVSGMKFYETWVKDNQVVTIDGFNYKFGEDNTVSLRKGNYKGDIEIPSQVTYDGKTYSVNSIDAAFNGCVGLTSVNIPNSVTTIGSGAFKECKDLKTVIIPNSVTSIDRAFSYCSSLLDLTIPNSVISIGDNAFEGCTGLKTITLSNNLTSIGKYAFINCENLKSITIPNSVTSIDECAFIDCHNLTDIILSDKLTTLGEYCFSYCYGLKSVYIPKSVLSIGDGAFSSCENIESIKVDSENSKYDSRNNCNAIIETYRNRLLLGGKNTVIPEDINRIGPSAFAHCNDLKDLHIPNSVKYIEMGAFSGCNGFSTFTIGNNVEYIGNYAFSECESLKSVIIPNNVKTIEYYAFYNCKKLKDVYCHPEVVPSTDKSVFEETPINKATLHVPAVSVEEYKTTEPWNGFGNIVALTGDETDIESHIIDNNASPVNIFSINGQRLSKPK